jgi:HlyD family secretion protein
VREGGGREGGGQAWQRGEGGQRAPREDLDVRTVWVLSGIDPRPVRIRIGLSDGTTTEITEGDLHPGDQLVTEVIGSDADKPPAAAPPGGGQPPGGLRRVF